MQRFPLAREILALAVVALPASGLFADGPRAILKEGASIRGRLRGASHTGFVFEPADQSAPLPARSLKHVAFDATLRRATAAGPIWCVTLHGGERLHATAAMTDDGAVSIGRNGIGPIAVPRAVVSSVAASIGEQPLLYEDFEEDHSEFANTNGALPVDAARPRSGRRSLLMTGAQTDCTWRPVEPIRAGRVELNVFDDGQVDLHAVWAVELEFRAAARTWTIHVVPGWDAKWRCETPGDGRFTDHELARQTGWLDLTIDFDEHRAVVLVNDDLLARGPTAETALTALRFVSRHGADNEKHAKPATAPPRAWVDDVRITRRVAPIPLSERASSGGLVWLSSGDEVLGEPVQLDARQVTLAGRFGRRTWPWRELRGVGLPIATTPGGVPVTGLIAWIELAPVLYSSLDECDRLLVAIERIDDHELVAAHPWLGRVTLPIDEVARVQPVFEGTLCLLDPLWRHLGDSIREDLTAKVPQGTRWERTFTLEALSGRQAWISLLASGLEPAGPAKPPKRPRRDINEAAFLETSLFLNGRRIDSLNRHVIAPARSPGPQRLRIPVPAGVLQVGANTIRLEQRPSRDDPHEFDDFEFSRMAIEFDQPDVRGW